MVCGLEGSHPEVCQLDIAIRIEKDILWLEVTMTDVESVAIGKASNDLPE